MTAALASPCSAVLWSSWAIGVLPFLASSAVRCNCRSAFAKVACAAASCALRWSTAASKGSRSIVKTTWPSLTSSPSLKRRGPRKPCTRARRSTFSSASARPTNSACLVIDRSSAGWTRTAGVGAACCASARGPTRTANDMATRRKNRLDFITPPCGSRERCQSGITTPIGDASQSHSRGSGRLSLIRCRISPSARGRSDDITNHLGAGQGGRPVRLARSYALRSASLALWEVGVLPVVENQRCENSHVKAKSRLLTIPGLRLPHLKPLAADDQKPEEPHQKPERRADTDQSLGAVEASGIGANVPEQDDRSDQEGQPGNPSPRMISA